MALIKCTQCGHSISDKSRKCPKCGALTAEKKTPIVEEVPIAGNDALTTESTPKKKNKRIIVISILVFGVLIGIIYGGTTFTSNTNSIEISNNAPIRTTNETVSPKTTKPTNLLTDENLTQEFLRLWGEYGKDREFIPYRNVEGYKITKGDLDGDGRTDAIINAYATATPEEKANRSYNNRSYIFCFLNNGTEYKLASITRFPSIYFVTKISDMVIYSNCYQEEDGEIINHNYKLEGGMLKQINPEIPMLQNDFDIEKELYGACYNYEGEMEGFPIKMSFTISIQADSVVEGEYKNIKYGTVLKLKGKLNSDRSLYLNGVNGSEKLVFKLYSPSPKYIEGYGINGDKSLKIKMEQKYYEIIGND